MVLEGGQGIENCPNFSILNHVKNKFDILGEYQRLHG